MIIFMSDVGYFNSIGSSHTVCFVCKRCSVRAMLYAANPHQNILYRMAFSSVVEISRIRNKNMDTNIVKFLF